MLYTENKKPPKIQDYRCLVGTLLLFFTIFLPVSGFCGATDASRFYGAELLEDGRTVLFSYTRAEYTVKSSSLINFGGGRAHYTKDRKYIGLYHIDRKKTEILYTVSQGHESRGRGNFKINATRGRTAMLQQQDSGDRYILDIDQRTMTGIDIDKEILDLGMVERGTVWLAYQDGSMVVRAYSEGQKEGQKNSVPLGHIWLRRGNGQYTLLTKLGSYSGTVDTEAVYYDHESRKSMTYSLVTGDRRVLSNRERADMKLYNTRYGKPNQDVYISPERDGKTLKQGRKIEGKWDYQPFPIDMKPLR